MKRGISRGRWLAAVAGLGLGLLSTPSLAATTDQDVRLGDRVVGKILAPGADSVGLGFYATKDAKVSLTVKRGEGSTLVPAIGLVGDGVLDLGSAYKVASNGKSAKVKNFVIPASGNYTFEVSGASGSGSFLAMSKGVFTKKYVLTGSLPASPAVTFEHRNGSIVSAKVVAAKDATLEPTIASVVDDGGPMTLENVTANGKVASFSGSVALDDGPCTLTVGGTGTGAFTATVKVKVSPSKEEFDVNSAIDGSLLAAVSVTDAPATPADFDAYPALSATASQAAAHGSTGHAYAGEYNMTGSAVAGADIPVDIRAAHDADYLYMRFRWKDRSGTHDLNRRRWYFNGGAAAVPDWNTQFGTAITSHPLSAVEAVPTGWSPNLNDDKIGVAWAIGNPDLIQTDGLNEAGLPANTTFRQAGCAIACHGNLDMAPPIGAIDLWHWKTSRSNPLGYVNDQWGGNGTPRTTDTNQGIENRNRVTDNASGPKYVLNPAAAGVTVDKAAGTATIGFNSVLWGTLNLDARLFLSYDAQMPIESTDAVGGQAVYATNCQSCHGATGRGVGKDYAKVGLTWTRAEIVAKANSVAHGGGVRNLDDNSGNPGTVSTADTDRLVARIRGFSGSPGYYLREGGAGGFAVNELPIVTNYQNVYDDATGEYTVVIKRKLQTADSAQDVQFSDLTGTYYFGLAVMDFDGQNHAGAPLLKMVLEH